MMRQQPLSNNEGPIFKKIQNYIFKFSDLLGQGNFSKVYRAQNEITKDIVAIKIVELQSLKSKKLQQLLFSQIDVLKKLNHPNVLRCFQVFTSNRNCYIITELCNEGDLQSRLRKQRQFDQYKAESFIRDIYEGLSYLAERNVIHRDLKVANVFLHNGRAKIADFGFAKFTKQKFKDINIGSPIYMSPQGFINNIYGPKTDVWAFGVLIYQLLHGETPYVQCRTQTELRTSLMIPINKNKFRSDISHEIKEVIMRCMQVDEATRITIVQLAHTSYFQRIYGKNQLLPPMQYQTNIHGSALELRLRSPSYNTQSSKLLRSEQMSLKRRISAEKPQLMSQNILQINQNYQKNTPSNFQPPLPMTTKNLLQLPQKSGREKRGISADRPYLISVNQIKRENIVDNKPKKRLNEESLNILSCILSFKQCVNILHYGRLIFKFLLTLKVSEYSNDNELFKLSKWLIELLEEIKIKMERKQVVYEGQNANLREQKLKQVRGEYQKKYRNQLANYIKNHQNFGEEPYNLEYIKNFCLNLYRKYDSKIEKQNNKSLLMLGHCVIMMFDATVLMKKCYEQKSYAAFLNYKDIEVFLNLTKEQFDLNSYLNYRKKMLNYY